MTLHLVKLAVGVADLAELRRVRAARARERGGDWIATRNRPRRTAEVLDGGSIYWVIRGRVQVRQRVTGFREEHMESGRSCLIVVDPLLIPTVPRPLRPFQGWRYLSPADAPPDLPEGQELPPESMLAELRALGLW